MLKIGEITKSLAVSILIGGKSSRFGSDKGLYEYHGKPLISYQIDTLSQKDYYIFLIANSKQQVQLYINNIDFKDITGFIVDDNNVTSDLKTQSPMVGLYSASKELKRLYDKVLVLACDNPFIHLDVIEFLISKSEGFDCCIPQWNNGFVEPLFAVYSTDKLFQKVNENLETNILKLSTLLDPSWNINYISIERDIQPMDKKLHTFININTLKDIENLPSFKFNENNKN